MNLIDPVWSLKTPRCPCCGEQGALCFATCPNCREIVFVCDEVGTVYPNPRNLIENGGGTLDDSSRLCPHCGTVPISDFKNSTSDEIRKLGFTASDYQ